MAPAPRHHITSRKLWHVARKCGVNSLQRGIESLFRQHVEGAVLDEISRLSQSVTRAAEGAILFYPFVGYCQSAAFGIAKAFDLVNGLRTGIIDRTKPAPSEVFQP